MESDQREDSMNSSSGEVDQLENDNNDDMGGTRRSYECVFCKRGFTTAQALGGHMNIHRRDRAKNRPASMINPSTKYEEIYYSRPRICHPISNHPTPYFPSSKTQFFCQTLFPASSSGSRSPLSPNPNYEFCGQIPKILSPFADDWKMSLSLQFGSHPEDRDGEKERIGGEEDNELDLELRLGYNP
ncbi:hypothetical protein NMG60_11014101 [Bertholletia excelsa]